MLEETPKPFFEEADIISTYTDAEAIEDGVLVAINPKDRVSRACWEWLAEKQPKDNRPPSCWPVAMMGWFQAATISKVDAAKMIAEHGAEEGQKKYQRLVADRKACALAIGVIEQNRHRAKRIYDENIGGGILCLYVRMNGETIAELTPQKTETRLWLIPNENNGITLMFPEDN